MYSTNYASTLILVAPDTKAVAGQVPARPGTIAALQYDLLAAAPYRYTSDELLTAVEARRRGLGPQAHQALAAEFFARPRACLRTSPLAKSNGWGLHHDAEGRVALVGCETDRYGALVADPSVHKVAAMRSSRAG
ncbi:DUF6157 family protein [Sinisalibacter aestuarii]|uniref:Uncharacterized protein n=1 Tax=Sinisalibacter aestuarii TaxID=2949426 RepID=A0ABQ5LV40_9RHOB|nr:DUF6157 family protein [Sinisalibacter aestuarii]GKY88847.1 hypothetical protein STA1M1_27160 [Sinisalibacter aestuarii]